MENPVQTKNNTRYTVGLIFIIIGALFLFDSLHIIDINFSRFISFPLILFVIGIIILVNSQKKTFGVVLTLVGGFLLIGRIFPGLHINWSIIFPVIIIAFGIYIILKHRSGGISFAGDDKVISSDYLDDVSIFGGGNKIINTDSFKGGNITAIFGGSEIDLRNSKLAEGNYILDVLCIFGGTEIHIPEDWNVIINVTPIFGGFSHKVRKHPDTIVDKSRSLLIKGVAIFGGGEVK